MKRIGLGFVCLLLVALIAAWLVTHGIPGKAPQTSNSGEDYVQEAKDAVEQYNQAIGQRTDESVGQ